MGNVPLQVACLECPSRATDRRLCRIHYVYRKYHGLEIPPRFSAEERWELRFWQNVAKTHDCWIWMGPYDVGGYGLFSRAGYTAKKAHRHSYELLVGPIPEGLVIDHLCRVRYCVNPSHMEPVTNAENLRRGKVNSPESVAKRVATRWALAV